MIADIRPVRTRRNAKEPPKKRLLLQDVRLYYAVANQHGSARLGRAGSLTPRSISARHVTSGTATGRMISTPSGCSS